MGDPLSIATGTIAVLEICTRVVRFARDVRAASKEIESSLNQLIAEIASLEKVVISVQKLREQWLERERGADRDEKSHSNSIDLWEDVKSTVQNCEASMRDFEARVQEIIGPDKASAVNIKSKMDGLKKTLRKQSRESKIQSKRAEIMGHQETLQLLLQLLTLLQTQRSQASIDQGMEGLSKEIVSQSYLIRRQLGALRSTNKETSKRGSRSLLADVAMKALAAARTKQHFHLPQAVNSLYTGREALLKQLREAIQTSPPSSQCRFVIHGLGGSGKTEFCCKYAEENRDSYWGIFKLDGRSEQTIRRDFAVIANLAKLGDQLGENADVAGKNWLANLTYPWMLIIDNVDSLSSGDLQKHFPEGKGGVILITTRNADLQQLGTTSPRSFNFTKKTLDRKDSTKLLLRAADDERTTKPVIEAAEKIARRLGDLPLALIQAGRAILNQISRCTLESYLDVYTRSWRYVRQKIARDPSRAGLSSNGIINVNVYSSVEIILQGLKNTKTLPAQDAVVILKIFSFLSNESIRFAILKTSISHARQRKKHDKEEADKASRLEGNSWMAWAKASYLWYLRQIDKSAPSLPQLLQDEHFEPERLNDALNQLINVSLISYDSSDESYSVHPLVHGWVREQPEMRTAEQALWCEVAGSVLAQSILLPPLDTIPSAEELKRHLLAHVMHVEECRKEIRNRLSDNTRARHASWKPFKPLGPIFTRQLALTYAKFSLIYYSNGMLSKAEELQLQVLHFIVGRLGHDNEGAWLIKLFLSQTYALQTNFNKAADLQEAVLKSSTRVLGRGHAQTLKYITILGTTRSYQARLKESKQLLQEAIDGFSKKSTSSPDEVLEAKHSLGMTMRRYTNYQACHQLYTEAFHGLTASNRFGPSHEKTWAAQEDYAISMLDLEGQDLSYALELVRDVKRKRKQRLGTQHPLTLLSRCNLARVYSGLGNHEKAEAILREHLPIAEANLGEHHFGTLMGKTYLALIIGRQKRYEEAEGIFKIVTNLEHYASSSKEDGEHIDRIYALRLLMQMYIEWGRYEEALRVCDELGAGVARIGGERLGLEHPINGWLEEKRREIQQAKAKAKAHDAAAATTASPAITAGEAQVGEGTGVPKTDVLF